MYNNYEGIAISHFSLDAFSLFICNFFVKVLYDESYCLVYYKNWTAYRVFFQGKGPYTFKDLRTQEWLIYAEYAIVGTVTLIIIGALGICCKKCCILLTREDDDDDNEDTNLNNRKSYFKKRQLFMSNSVRSVHW